MSDALRGGHPTAHRTYTHREGIFAMHRNDSPRWPHVPPGPATWPPALRLEWERRVAILTAHFGLNPPDAEARARGQLKAMARRWR